MHRFLILAAGSLAGCSAEATRHPVQPPEQVVTAFAAALRGCSAGLTPEGSIDQAALAASGWRVTRRSTRYETESRELALDAYPTLRSTEYEATEWVRDDVPNRIELIRGDDAPGSLQDSCNVIARTEAGAVRNVVAAVARGFGRPADRSGERPRGGDFLTPRSDPASFVHYWALPRHDVYVTVGENGYLNFEVVAMPDRAALDQYSPDRPENRIPEKGQP